MSRSFYRCPNMTFDEAKRIPIFNDKGLLGGMEHNEHWDHALGESGDMYEDDDDLPRWEYEVNAYNFFTLTCVNFLLGGNNVNHDSVLIMKPPC